MYRKSKSDRPRTNLCLETMENRECPATLVAYDAATDTLTITGDNTANVVTLLHDDSANRVHVLHDGIDEEFFSSDVKVVKVDLKGGRDTFTQTLAAGSDFSFLKSLSIQTGAGPDKVLFDLVGNASDWADLKENLTIFLETGDGSDEVQLNIPYVEIANFLDFRANLGNGADKFNAISFGSVGIDASAKIDVRGGNGNDTLTYFGTYNAQAPGAGLKVGDLGSFSVLFDGGNGADRLNATYAGEVDGDCTIYLNGDLGDVGAQRDWIDIHMYTSAASTGKLTVFAVGQRGNDVMRVLAEGYVPGGSQLLADGGLGKDQCISTFNVSLDGIEVF
jgi:hypothetical protein